MLFLPTGEEPAEAIWVTAKLVYSCNLMIFRYFSCMNALICCFTSYSSMILRMPMTLTSWAEMFFFLFSSLSWAPFSFLKIWNRAFVLSSSCLCSFRSLTFGSISWRWLFRQRGFVVHSMSLSFYLLSFARDCTFFLPNSGWIRSSLIGCCRVVS